MNRITFYRYNFVRTNILFLLLVLSGQSLVVNAGLPDFADLAEELLPSVVVINTVQKSKPYGGGAPNGQVPDLFRYYFGDGFQMPEQKREAQGSGIILSDGYILTNQHVVAGADEITIRLHDHRVLDAVLVGGDELSDLALLKVEDDDLNAVDIGDSDELRIGEWVMAIGTPFGFDHSVTSGIVSAKGRTLSRDNYVPFIQTDVAINPGNSGGPLFNLDGELVGINSQIYSRTGGFMGLSFAIPTSIAMKVVKQLKDDGVVARGWLGVVIHDVNRNLARSLGLDKPTGAIVAKVLGSGPAGKGGIRVEDVILRFDGREIVDSSSLRNYVGAFTPGQTVAVVVSRAGKKETLKITLGSLPKGPYQANAMPNRGLSPQPGEILGLVVITVSVEKAAQWGISGGVVVQKVSGGAAKEAGIRVGDVITNVANQPIKNEAGFLNVVKQQKKGKWVPILINRQGAPEFLAIEIR
ncbi:hypothetical protein A9Q81_15115 [Gammaproteobacteria bacterium 42_54_T18]|nr:hypothetical protein A9Q81_15115 [Gammaproteobacteria bacterium 42_54_T18]